MLLDRYHDTVNCAVNNIVQKMSEEFADNLAGQERVIGERLLMTFKNSVVEILNMDGTSQAKRAEMFKLMSDAKDNMQNLGK